MVGFERRGKIIRALTGLVMVQRSTVRLWASPFFYTMSGVAGQWVLINVRHSGGGALGLNMNDGCGMVGENFSLEGT
jgi:hypothetical protein